MKDDAKYSRKNGYDCEYDDYPIPPYDEALSDKERIRALKENRKEADNIIEQILG